MSNIQNGIFANLGLVMAGLLAKRLNDLGQLDEATLKALRELIDQADADFPEGSSDAVSILANLRLWLHEKP